VDEADGDGVEEVELLPAPAPGDDQTGVLQLLQVLHHAEAGHLEPLLEGVQRLPVLAEQLVEQGPPGGIGQRSKDLVHASRICD
jgi:hypothetical protein